MPAGRPSDFKPQYCDDVIEYGKSGKSLTWIATEIGVSKQTLHNWKDAHPEFMDALTRAKEWAQRWWEDKGQSGLEVQGFNASVWSRSMAARFPDDWREIKGAELTGKDGAPIKTESAHTVDMSGLSTEALRELSKLPLT